MCINLCSIIPRTMRQMQTRLTSLLYWPGMFALLAPQQDPSFDRRPGVILHQPLSLQIFVKNSENRQIMNGPAVYPRQKTENAPTWRPRKHFFGGYFSAYFGLFFAAVCLSPNVLILPIFNTVRQTLVYHHSPNPIPNISNISVLLSLPAICIVIDVELSRSMDANLTRQMRKMKD